MRTCRKINEAIAEGRFPSLAAAGRAFGIGKGLRHKYGRLSGLCEQLQRDVLDGKAARCSIADLLRIAAIHGTEQQLDAFERLVQARAQAPARRQRNAKCRTGTHAQPQKAETLRVRAVAYFNPQRFVDQRIFTRGWVHAIEQFVEELNAKLAGPRSRLTRQGITAAVDRKLRRYDLVGAFNLKVTEHKTESRSYYQIELCLDESGWSKRRRYDGFTVLVSHPDLPSEPEQLCRLYRSKDTVEKDFQVVKSVANLRPIRHRTDSKVRAHVTLCMLALLLTRSPISSGTCTPPRQNATPMLTSR